MTMYLILRRDGSADRWISTNTVEARSPQQAIEKAIAPGPAKDGEEPVEPTAGEFVAVPARNWKPVKVKVEPQPPKLTFS